jgi:hypothetical protein
VDEIVLENRANADQQTRGGRSDDDAQEDAENAAAAPRTSTAEAAAPGRFPPKLLNTTVVTRLAQPQP